ncbi:MAG TPA: cation transporter [Thermoanaerobaculia bacterium]|nr:cation transporter [Thermoanaerobaculia bacterium]
MSGPVPRQDTLRRGAGPVARQRPASSEAGAAPRDWARSARWLVGSTMAYNALEGVLAIAAGIAAASIALVGFGLDSFIELAAAGALFWRLRVEARGASVAVVEHTERRVHQFIGGTFLALALYVTGQAGWVLWRAEAPEESRLGIALAVASLLVMPLIAWGKLRAARHLGSAALRAEARETLACSYLSFTLLLGLGANALAGWWWADPVAALLMVPWLVREGLEGLRGESCCD